MKLGLSFGADKYAYWQDKLIETLRDLGLELIMFDGSTQESLEHHAPEIIVGHESDALIAYLKSRPEQLRWVQIMSAGLNRTLNALGKEPVSFHITNMRGIHANAMAEYLLAVLLYFEKHLDYFFESKSKERWRRMSLGQLYGKHLLVCGAGGIGQHVGEVLSRLGVSVDAIVRNPGPRTPFRQTYSLTDLSNIISDFDYVFCALPLTDDTCNAFNRNTIMAMKDGAIFVNISRGEIVDDDALTEALLSGKLAGAALDVFKSEPLPPDSTFWTVPNLIITPHVSGRFDNGHALGLALFKKNMLAYLSETSLVNEVFPERGY